MGLQMQREGRFYEIAIQRGNIMNIYSYSDAKGKEGEVYLLHSSVPEI